jgi:hypothetical protein
MDAKLGYSASEIDGGLLEGVMVGRKAFFLEIFRNCLSSYVSVTIVKRFSGKSISPTSVGTIAGGKLLKICELSYLAAS